MIMLFKKKTIMENDEMRQEMKFGAACVEK